MKPSAWIVAAVSLAACSAASPSSAPPDGGVAVSDAGPGPGAFAADYATSPRFFTQMKARRKGLASSPHDLVRIYYSKNIEPLVGLASFVAPDGTVAIKEQDMNGDGTVDALKVMIKKPGTDPQNGDWFYEDRAPDGTLNASGKIDFCVGCHVDFPATSELAGVSLRD